jgi:hypothetical protein
MVNAHVCKINFANYAPPPKKKQQKMYKCNAKQKKDALRILRKAKFKNTIFQHDPLLFSNLHIFANDNS